MKNFAFVLLVASCSASHKPADKPGVEFHGSAIEPYFEIAIACVRGEPYLGRTRSGAPLDPSPTMVASGNGEKLLFHFMVAKHEDQPGVLAIVDVATKRCESVSDER